MVTSLKVSAVSLSPIPYPEFQRTGDYRIYRIDEERSLVVLLDVGFRESVYG